MNTSINISNIIPIITFFQCYLFAVILFTYKGVKKISNIILAVFLIILGTQLLFVTIEDVLSINLFEYTLFCFFDYTYGPLIFLYTVSLTYRDFSLRSKYFLHFGIPILFLCDILFRKRLCPDYGAFTYLSLTIYLFLSIRVLIKYRKVIANTRSSVSKIDLKWLQWIMVVFSIVLALSMIDTFIIHINMKFNFSLIDVLLLIFVNWIFYKGFKQPQIFQGISLNDESMKQRQKIMKIGDLDDKVKKELAYISSYINENKPYLTPELSLKDLSLKMKMPARRISYLINMYHGKDFMNYINDFRINLAKDRLRKSDQKETVLEIMYSVGFNSKSSFNTFFKRNTGLTPTQYKKQVNKKINHK